MTKTISDNFNSSITQFGFNLRLVNGLIDEIKKPLVFMPGAFWLFKSYFNLFSLLRIVNFHNLICYVKTVLTGHNGFFIQNY